jgi:hypothetical protein
LTFKNNIIENTYIRVASVSPLWPMTSQADACSYCMGSVVLILSRIYLHLQLLWYHWQRKKSFRCLWFIPEWKTKMSMVNSGKRPEEITYKLFGSSFKLCLCFILSLLIYVKIKKCSIGVSFSPPS